VDLTENCIHSIHGQVQNAGVISGLMLWETMNSSGGVSFISNFSVHGWYIQKKVTCVLTTNQSSHNHLLVLGFLLHFDNFFKILF
jgi:hypothetical protein